MSVTNTDLYLRALARVRECDPSGMAVPNIDQFDRYINSNITLKK